MEGNLRNSKLVGQSLTISQRTTYSYGQKIYDRIDFEELALKSLDPTTGPSVADLAESSNSVQPLEKGNRITVRVSLVDK
jgi:hypothetical protein